MEWCWFCLKTEMNTVNSFCFFMESSDILRCLPDIKTLTAHFILNCVQFNNLLPFKPVQKLIYICTYKQVNPSLWALQSTFSLFFNCVCVFHFYYSCDIFTKVRYQHFMYLWFVCCWRQTTGVWHTGSCKLSIASAVMLFRFANKGGIFSTLVSVLLLCTATHHRESSDKNLNKIQSLFIIYITYNAILQGFLHIHCIHSSAHWSESTSLKSPETHPGVDRRAKKKKLKNNIYQHSCVDDIYSKTAESSIWLFFFFFFFYTKVLSVTLFRHSFFWHKINSPASMMSLKCWQNINNPSHSILIF